MLGSQRKLESEQVANLLELKAQKRMVFPADKFPSSIPCK
jgi:hypothetical protein